MRGGRAGRGHPSTCKAIRVWHKKSVRLLCVECQFEGIPISRIKRKSDKGLLTSCPDHLIDGKTSRARAGLVGDGSPPMP